MVFHVCFQICHLRETFLTIGQLAFVRLVPGVDAFVSLQMGLLLKGFFAEIAGKTTNVGMDEKMLRK